MATKLFSGQVVGLEGLPIEIEIDLTPGLHHFSIVGLPDKAVEEAKERVSSAIKNSGFRPPQKKNHRVIINLAPADLKKEGPAFDVAIALGYILASGQTTFDTDKKFFIGELALNGAVRPVKGALTLTLAARKAGFSEIFIPKENGKEASLVKDINIYECSSLQDLAEHLENKVLISPTKHTSIIHQGSVSAFDFSDIHGQEFAKRGIEIAASGRHHTALVGPPGTGKTLLARAIPSILPPLSFDEAIEITSIHSIAGILGENLATQRPFRNPHHTASYVSLVGGGAFPKPGEVTLAHRGVLFLDEFPEFDRKVIETLRQPLEDRVITISRARGSIAFPAHIMLAAALNPCPCGNRGSQKECVCSPRGLALYQRKLSGPIIDRIDIWLDVPQVEHRKLEETVQRESSEQVRDRVMRAYEIQRARFAGTAIASNSEMGIREIKKYCALGTEEKNLLQSAARNLDLSARAYHRVLKVSRTIADLAGSENITKEHLLESLQFRPKELV